MTIGLTNDQYYNDIADAIREKRPDLPLNQTFKPSEMSSAIREIKSSYKWVRPTEWPDLDSVYSKTQKNVIYMTVDATGRFDHPCVKFYVTTADDGDCTIQTGTISNGVFTAITTETKGSATSSDSTTDWEKEWTPSAGYYPVIKVTATSLKNIAFLQKTNSIGTSERIPHVIEMVGHADYVFVPPNLGSSAQIIPKYLVHEAIGADYVSSGTDLKRKWASHINLESLDLSNWNTTNWEITSLENTWYSCYSLKEINMSGWDTTNWAVTSLKYTWGSCKNLLELDLSNWNTSNWPVSTLEYTWNYCYNLKELDLSNWDTTNWEVTSMVNTWYYCSSLTNLNLSSWDTSNWEVTTMQNTFNYTGLTKIDISMFDSNNWAVTSFSSFTTYSDSLIELYLPNDFFSCYTGTSIISISNENLSRNSILSIFNATSTSTTTKKLNIGTINNNKMTNAEKAIVTNKGWTLS